MVSVNINSVNYEGKSAIVTFYPYTGGTINLGVQVIPFDYVTEYYYGTYEMYFEEYSNTCTLYILPFTTTTTTIIPITTTTTTIIPYTTTTTTIIPITTTTTTLSPQPSKLLTQNNDTIITQNGDNLII